jgi:hypothetical protein
VFLVLGVGVNAPVRGLRHPILVLRRLQRSIPAHIVDRDNRVKINFYDCEWVRERLVHEEAHPDHLGI